MIVLVNLKEGVTPEEYERPSSNPTPTQRRLPARSKPGGTTG